MPATAIRKFISFFHPPFRRFFPLQTFYYAVCGAVNTILGLLAFYISFHYIFQKELVQLSFFTMSPHIASMLVSYIVSFAVGFVLARYVVFSESVLRGHQQLIRYWLTSLISLFLNYANLKIMVDTLGWFPTVAQILNVGIVITFSYLMQKYFAFHNRGTRVTTRSATGP